MNLPVDFIRNMQFILGTETEAFLSSLDEPPPVSIRLNPFKRFPRPGLSAKIPWCEQGYYLQTRPSFTTDPFFHAGCYYVQEASSMFIEDMIRKHVNKPVKALDFCAAPGGKSTHLLSLLPEGSFLVSNEIIPLRNSVLRENLAKWGQPNVFVTQNESTAFARVPGYFDLVLVDAPCSGEGLFRREPEAVNEWSETNVSRCESRQSSILKDIVEALAPGGILIFSTCTYESRENEDRVRELCGKEGMELIQQEVPYPGIVSTDYGFRFYPHRVSGEGFFISILRKKSGQELLNRRINKNGLTMVSFPEKDKYLKDSGRFTFFENDGRLFALPSFMKEDLSTLRSELYLRSAGIPVGERRGKDFIPSAELALSVHASDEIPRLRVNGDDALDFLRGKSFNTKSDLRGWCIVSYENTNLGWVKIIDAKRLNNYYPKEWRIRNL